MEQTRFNKPFFNEVEPIKIKDPLAIALGAMDKNEPFVFTYTDAIKLAGHSCPAISGAYKLTQIALKALYGNEIPVRGQIRVTCKGGVDYRVNGPISQILTLITGASGESGFKGLGGGRYNRQKLLSFDEKQEADEDAVCTVIFERMDTKKKIEISYSNYMLPADPKMGELMPLAVTGKGSDEEAKKFGELWHDRIKTILLNPPDEMFVIRELS
ncbi:MAG: FmdE family protein [Candidatus Loosdrechtia sp.]|uniref:FmdE family protein n=1 Tax=Candidatus Loosdrechtia sp. TaxID=3101272 RepID=UPI003A739F14|nr:MAG: FmdE family protein [Candidatus Jettenia sp. AMX2]